MRVMIQKLIDARAATWEQGKALLDGAVAENRDLTAEETASWEKMNADLSGYDERIAELTELETRNAKADETRDAYERLTHDSEEHRAREDADKDAALAFLRGETRSLDVSFAGLDIGHDADGRVEVRDLSVGTTTAGGHTVPTSFARRLYEYVIESAGILNTRATVINTAGGEAMDFPKNDAGGSATLVAEAGALQENDPTFAKMTLNAYKYATLVQVTRELAEDSAVDILGFVARDAGRAVGDDFGEDAAIGDGSSKPNGVMTAATSNVGGTGQSGVPTADELIDLYYATENAYARSGEWFMRRTTEGVIRKLVDGNSQYLWQPGLQIASPNTLLGAPIVQDPFVVAPALNARSVGFGDFSAYYVRIAGGMRFERSDDFAFANDLISFRAVMRADGDLIDPNAINVYTGGAS